MARPRADVRKAELLEKLSDVAFVIVDAEALGDDALEVDPPPAHDAVDFSVGTGLDDRGELRLLAADRRGFGPFAQWSSSPSGPAALKR